MTDVNASQRWRFFRAGGFDQVRLDTGAELLAIGNLDQKLWVALSCPTTGIEFDTRTLTLLDSDGDGHIRAPELIAATQWAGARLKDVETLAAGLSGVAPAAIREDDEEGRPKPQEFGDQCGTDIGQAAAFGAETGAFGAGPAGAFAPGAAAERPE